MKKLYISYDLCDEEWIKNIEEYLEEKNVQVTSDIYSSEAYLFIVSRKNISKTRLIKELEEEKRRGIQPIFGLIEIMESPEADIFFENYSNGIRIDLANGGKEALDALVCLCKQKIFDYTFDINANFNVNSNINRNFNSNININGNTNPNINEKNRDIFSGDISNNPDYLKYMEKIARKRQKAFYDMYKVEKDNQSMLEPLAEDENSSVRINDRDKDKNKNKNKNEKNNGNAINNENENEKNNGNVINNENENEKDNGNAINNENKDEKNNDHENNNEKTSENSNKLINSVCLGVLTVVGLVAIILINLW